MSIYTILLSSNPPVPEIAPVFVLGRHFGSKTDKVLLEQARANPYARIGIELLPTSFHTYSFEEKLRLCDYIDTGNPKSGRLRELLKYDVYGLSPVERTGDLIEDYKKVEEWRMTFSPKDPESIRRYENDIKSSIKGFKTQINHTGGNHSNLPNQVFPNARIILASQIS